LDQEHVGHVQPLELSEAVLREGYLDLEPDAPSEAIEMLSEFALQLLLPQKSLPKQCLVASGSLRNTLQAVAQEGNVFFDEFECINAVSEQQQAHTSERREIGRLGLLLRL
jgi:hypothetical protein